MIPYTIKKFLATFFGFFISQMMFAQQRYQLDSIVNQWSHYEVYTQVHRQAYDPVNRLLVSLNEVRDAKGEQDEGTKQTSQYDERGNELLQVDSYWNTEKKKWIDRKKSVKTYDDNDRTLSHTQYEMQGENWVGALKNTYEFEEKSVTATRYRRTEKQWLPVAKNVHLFNENDKEILTISYQWDNTVGDWANWTQHENIFLKDSLLQESVTYTWKDGKWTDSEKIIYKYTPDTEKVTDIILYTSADSVWQFKLLTQTKYYDAIRREEAFCWSQEENKWTAQTFKEIYTDQHGRATDFVEFVWNVDSTEYRRRTQGMTVYDEQDRVTQIQEIRYENGRIISGMETLFHFDEDGNLYRQAHRLLIGKHWFVQETTEFTFNKEIVLHNEQGEEHLSDQARMGHEQFYKNRHAIDSIRRYRQLDGEMVLQEEWKYYYSIID